MYLSNSFFKEQIVSDQKQIIKKGPLRLVWKIILACIIIAFIISSIFIINFSFARNGWGLFWSGIKDFFSPNSYSNLWGENLFLLSLKFLWNSIKIVLLSTSLGFVLAFISAYFSNYKMNSKYVAIPVKFLVIFLRIFPELFFIYLFKISFDKELSIYFILSWFSWLWLHEYFSQTIENVNFNIFYHLTKTKYSKFRAFWIEIWPQIRKKITGYFFYAFESNIRWATILANLGFLGIGILTNPQNNPLDYTQLLIPLLVLVIFLFLVELVSLNMNKLFFENKTTNVINQKKYSQKKITKKIIGLIIVLSLVIICIFGISSIAGKKFYASGASSYFKEMFNGKWSAINLSFQENGIFYMLIEFGALIFITWCLVYLISYFKVLIMTRSLVGLKTSLIFKYINLFIRAIPIVTIFLIFSNLFNGFSAAFVIAFGIHSASSLSRNLALNTNALNQEKIDALKKMKYSSFWIYRNYVRPMIKLEFITLASFEIEKLVRNFITYGYLSSSLLGQHAAQKKHQEISDVAPYLWIGLIIIATVSLVSYLIRLKYTKQKWK
ncbi:ABC transporter permease [Mycoplasma enhydrae]|nr:ABC transporter permease subunit [Mycoplasma enhydrae]MCV3733697.1 ABC transporter permease [Mycoplasma enhydrae]